MKRARLIALFLYFAAIILFTTGCIDIDYMINQYRYSEAHRALDEWYFAPYFKMEWHLAYVFTLVRIVVGAMLFGFLVSKFF